MPDMTAPMARPPKAAGTAAHQIQEMEQVQNATSRDLFLRFATEVELHDAPAERAERLDVEAIAVHSEEVRQP